MESQPQNPEFRKNPENFHTCIQEMNITCPSSIMVCISLNIAFRNLILVHVIFASMSIFSTSMSHGRCRGDWLDTCCKHSNG